jgi:hypothetical protein
LQNYANSFVFSVVIFFTHVRKENLVTFFNIAHQRSGLINTAQIVISYVLAVNFSTTGSALRTLKRCFCASRDNRLLGIQSIAKVMCDHALPHCGNGLPSCKETLGVSGVSVSLFCQI